MITGKTGEKILIGGQYYCSEHTDDKQTFIKDDIFPRCSKEGHETTWHFKAPDAANTVDVKNETPKEEKPLEKEKAVSIDDSKQSNESRYKKKGFFAAIDYRKSNGQDNNNKLKEIIIEEDCKIKDSITLLDNLLQDKIEKIHSRYELLNADITEKEKIKEDFERELEIMQTQFNDTQSEIMKNYEELRQEIQKLGADKKDLIKNRIDEFESEINKIIEIYQNLEKTQNKKFKEDFEGRKLKDSDKQFYYDYRDKLRNSFEDIQKRKVTLEKNGLNVTVANFLILVGWIGCFTTSWYFTLWYSGATENSVSNKVNIIVYILDGIRIFTAEKGWVISIVTFICYILLIWSIAKKCYKKAKKHNFIIDAKSSPKDNKDRRGTINFSIDRESILRAQFNAGSWYEMWLKSAPFLTMVILLVIILATNKDSDSYSSLSNSQYLQIIGILLPISTMPILFLYITRIVETRDYEYDGKAISERHKASHNRELYILTFLFILQVVLFLFHTFFPGFMPVRAIGAVGFLLGSLSAGFALTYGYRYISLRQTESYLVYMINRISGYIEWNYYAAEASYLKDGEKLQGLYYSLLELVESRNRLGINLLDPNYKEDAEQYKKILETLNQEGKEEEPPTKASVTVENPETEKQQSLFMKYFNKIFKKKYGIKFWDWLKLKNKKIKELKNEITENKKDNVTLEELIYFPEIGAKVRQYKSIIEKLEKRLVELKEEMDGRYKNEKTYASIRKQIEEIREKIIEVWLSETVIREEFNKDVNQLNDDYQDIIIWITEGYNLGEWFVKAKPEMI